MPGRDGRFPGGGRGTFGWWRGLRRRTYGLTVDDPASAGRQPLNGVATSAGRRDSRRGRSLLLVLGLAAVIGLGAIGVARATAESCGPFARGECVRVLFLGNSYTYVNDLPAVFRHLARAAGRNVETGMVANGGETLAQHAASPESLAAIRAPSWRFVILQEQSEIPAIASVRMSQMVPAAETLVSDIRATAATPVLLDTWAHRDGLPGTSLGYAGMQAAIDEAYAELGGALGVLGGSRRSGVGGRAPGRPDDRLLAGRREPPERRRDLPRCLRALRPPVRREPGRDSGH